jgi:hypothetical protein
MLKLGLSSARSFCLWWIVVCVLNNLFAAIFVMSKKSGGFQTTNAVKHMSLLSTRFPGSIKACSVIQFSWDSCSLCGGKLALITWLLRANASLMSVFEPDEVDSSLATRRLGVFIVQNGSREPCLPLAKGCIRKPMNGILSAEFEHNVEWWWGWKRERSDSLDDPSPYPFKDSNPVSFSKGAWSTFSLIEGRMRQGLLLILQP